ncbi:MAG: hypothetical protein IT176_08955 [Acidobacteria bacterium]|nr:hypothetical protein [Acidobacteriota bacterium]
MDLNLLLALAIAAAQPLAAPNPAAVQTPAVEAASPVAASAPGDTGAPLGPDQDAAARSWLDRTAMWVGDAVVYTVRIVCAPGIDVLDDDLAGDKLKLDGLELVDLATSRTGGPDGTTIREFRYRVTTYKVEQTLLSIAPMAVRYYRVRPGQGVEGGEAAGEMAVPGATLALRSMLPDARDTAALRNGRGIEARPRLFAAAGPVGAGLLVASIVPVFFWTVGLVIRLSRPKGDRRSARQVKRDERMTLDGVRALDLSDLDARREAYTTISGLVRGHLREVTGVPGHALTGAEVEPALADRATRIRAEEIRGFLNGCDAARYGPRETVPSAEACRAAIDEAARLLTLR